MAIEVAHTKRDEIIQMLGDAIDKALGRKASEPQLVANLVFEVVNEVNRSAGKIFKGTGVTVSAGGVFVHQQPFVKFAGSKKKYIEIGDLLLIATHKNKHGKDYQTAMLLQAKKEHSFPPKPDNDDQHNLYAVWPRFEYIKSTPKLNGQSRKVVGPNLYNGAKYLFLNEGVPSGSHSATCGECSGLYIRSCCVDEECVELDCDTDGYQPVCTGNHTPVLNAYTAFPTKPALSNFRCFTQELYDLLFCNAGRAFEYSRVSKRGWDQVVNDLLEVTADQLTRYMGRASNGVSTKRGRLFFALGGLDCLTHIGRKSAIERFSADEGVEQMDGPPEIPPEWLNDYEDDGGAISIIQLVVEENEVEELERY